MVAVVGNEGGAWRGLGLQSSLMILPRVSRKLLRVSSNSHVVTQNIFHDSASTQSKSKPEGEGRVKDELTFLYLSLSKSSTGLCFFSYSDTLYLQLTIRTHSRLETATSQTTKSRHTTLSSARRTCGWINVHTMDNITAINNQADARYHKQPALEPMT